VRIRFFLLAVVEVVAVDAELNVRSPSGGAIKPGEDGWSTELDVFVLRSSLGITLRAGEGGFGDGGFDSEGPGREGVGVGISDVGVCTSADLEELFESKVGGDGLLERTGVEASSSSLSVM
jgi:hypothetical protein